MRKAAACIAIALLSACPAEDRYGVQVEPPDGAGEATDLAVGEWEARIGAELDRALLPEVLWFDGQCLDVADPPLCIEGYILGSTIELVWRRRPSSSQLAHELLHWALWRRDADLDKLHESPHWREVSEVNDELRASGL